MRARNVPPDSRPLFRPAALVHGAKAQSHFLETVRGARALKLFGRQEQRRQAWLALTAEAMNAELHGQRLAIGFAVASGLIFGIENIAIIWLGAQAVTAGTLSVGLLVAFIAYKSMFGTRVSGLIDKLIALAMLRLHAERLADILLTPAEPQPPVASPAEALPPSRVEIRQVRFRHGAHEPWLFDGLDLRLEPGESVAIVGPSARKPLLPPTAFTTSGCTSGARRRAEAQAGSVCTGGGSPPTVAGNQRSSMAVSSASRIGLGR